MGRKQKWQRNRSIDIYKLFLQMNDRRGGDPEQEGAVARRFYPMLPWVADAGAALLPHAPMWPASRAIYGSVSNSQDEEGASTGSKIERPVNVVVVIDQSEQIGTQGLAHSHDHPIYREKSCSVLRFGISCQHIQNACDVDPLRNSKQADRQQQPPNARNGGHH